MGSDIRAFPLVDFRVPTSKSERGSELDQLQYRTGFGRSRTANYGWRRLIAICAAITVSAVTAKTAVAQVAESAGSADLVEKDVVWSRTEGIELLARIYRPEGGGATPRPALLDVHGGGWNLLDRTLGAYYDRAIARAGFLVVAIDFRQGPDHHYPAASDDVAAAVRWLRLNSADLGVDPERIGLIGTSSGGQLALLAGLRPSKAGVAIIGSNGAAVARDDVSAAVDFIVALSPVSDPLARYRYAQRAGLDRLVALHEAYFASEEAMRDASIPALLAAGEGIDPLPPVLIVQSGMDSNVPAEMTLDLVRAYQGRDGHVEYAYYPRMPHAFGLRPSPEADDMIALVVDFARRHFAQPGE